MSSSDTDRQSVEQAEKLVESAAGAQKSLGQLPQQKIDQIVDRMAAAALAEARRLGESAHQETGFGVAADKATKNRFSAEIVYNFIRPMRTVGVIRETESVIEVASPRGVVAAIIPSTNPTSTAIFKILIAIKARDAIVLSPHPSAANCINETASVMTEAALTAGLPPGAIGCMSTATIEGTQTLMKHKATALILATGGIGLVRAAYSSGKPAFGVGPGNVPAMIERSANVVKAVKDILTGKCFDNGTICSSEQAVVVDKPVDAEVRAAFVSEGAYFLNQEEQDRLVKVVATPENRLNAKIVGKSAKVIAEMAGISLPDNIRAMICPLEGVGRDYPLSMEKLSPILAYYVVDGLEQGCERAGQVLRFGGMGHTASIHTKDRDAAREYGIRMPASRVIVCSPSTHGAIGFTTDLEPSMTLGCGSWGGNVTSDNISPRHLLDIKRIAFETRPINREEAHEHPAVVNTMGNGDSIAALVDRFLADRQSSRRRAPSQPVIVAPPPPVAAPTPSPVQAIPPQPEKRAAQSNGRVYDFVCEDDVKRAIAAKEKIQINSRTIITPAARDLGEAQEVFVKPA
ncbi:MAG TPA: aldehyde dehydrogenase family protein [Blastocatellia bacterium]|nr:aldehyde dehydrogenase family protein [Blastocatellia bacterium]